MKNNRTLVLLMLEAPICMLLCLAGIMPGQSFMALVTFPFAPLGQLLRAWSLSGGLGNAVALAVYLIVCMWPFCCSLFAKGSARQS